VKPIATIENIQSNRPKRSFLLANPIKGVALLGQKYSAGVTKKPGNGVKMKPAPFLGIQGTWSAGQWPNLCGLNW
jgi:hypothetical protein